MLGFSGKIAAQLVDAIETQTNDGNRHADRTSLYCKIRLIGVAENAASTEFFLSEYEYLVAL